LSVYIKLRQYWRVLFLCMWAHRSLLPAFFFEMNGFLRHNADGNFARLQIRLTVEGLIRIPLSFSNLRAIARTETRLFFLTIFRSTRLSPRLNFDFASGGLIALVQPFWWYTFMCLRTVFSTTLNYSATKANVPFFSSPSASTKFISASLAY